jgi:hypothetical protein
MRAVRASMVFIVLSWASGIVGPAHPPASTPTEVRFYVADYRDVECLK